MDQNLYHFPPTLEDERIKLVPLEMEHAEALYNINSKENWSFLLGEVTSLEEMKKWVQTAINMRTDGKALPFVVMIKENNAIAGTTRLFDINFAQKSCELGSTWYGVHYQRTFVNTSCKLLLMTYCFEELKFIRLQLKTDERNIRSQKAIERIGAIREGMLRNERILPNGYIRNACLYSIIDSEWPAVKQKLLNKASTYSDTTEL